MGQVRLSHRASRRIGLEGERGLGDLRPASPAGRRPSRIVGLVWGTALAALLVVAAFVASREPAAAAQSGYRAQVMLDNPVGYWRLGEASGTAATDETATP